MPRPPEKYDAMIDLLVDLLVRQALEGKSQDDHGHDAGLAKQPSHEDKKKNSRKAAVR